MRAYAGLSLREIYAQQCEDLHCKKNSSVCSILPETPDDFHTLKSIDLSQNFLGPKGILPLLSVIGCCPSLRELNFSGQNLQKESIDMICSALRTHPSVVQVNFSDNPLNIAAGASILELVKANPNLKHVFLDKTLVRSAVHGMINAQLEKNREMKLKGRAAADSSGAADKCLPQVMPSECAPSSRPCADSTSQAVGGNQKHESASPIMHHHRPIPLCEVDSLLSSFPSTVHAHLFDENPLSALASLCIAKQRMFYDYQFPADDTTLHRCAASFYGVAAWRRASELFPHSPFLPCRGVQNGKSKDTESYELPHGVHKALSWIFTCVASSVPHVAALHELLIAPSGTDQVCGLYGARLFVDGAWRFVLVDDYLPVNREGELLFAKPADDGQYIWPCILEKIMAKVYGGYHVVGTAYRQADQFMEDVYPASGAVNACHSGKDNAKPSVPPCARMMADITGGMPIIRHLHAPEFGAESWWATMYDMFATPIGETMAVAVSRGADKAISGIAPSSVYYVAQVRQLCGMKLIEMWNPWVSTQWTGDWAEESHLWEEFPDVKLALHGSRQARCPILRTDISGVIRTQGDSAVASTITPYTVHHAIGRPATSRYRTSTMRLSTTRSSFWISYTDFLQAFEEVHLCRRLTGYNEHVERGCWDHRSAGGPSSGSSWFTNPHYRLRVQSPGAFFVNLSLPDRRFSASDVDALGLHVLQDECFPLRCSHATLNGSAINDGSLVVFHTNYVQGDSVSFEGVLEGKHLWIVPSTFTSGRMGRFILRVGGTSAFSVSVERLQDHWHMRTIDVAVPFSGDLQTGDRNAQVALTLAENCALSRTVTDRSGRLLVKAKMKVALPAADERERVHPSGSNVIYESEGAGKAASALALYVCRAHHSDDGTIRRAVGLVPEEEIHASTPLLLGDSAYVEAEVSPGASYNVLCCIYPVGTFASLQVTVWSTINLLQMTPLSLWPEHTVSPHWGSGSGTFYSAIDNPQVELFPVRCSEIYAIRLDVTGTSGNPAIMLYVLRNAGRQGEGLYGSISEDLVVARSECVQSNSVLCEVCFKEDMDSALLVPLLLPAGSTGRCTVTVSSATGAGTVRILSVK